MGGYRHRSELIPFVPLRPLISDCVVTIPVPGAMAVRIIFDQNMDTTNLPAVGTFTITSDGVPLVVTPIAWDTPLLLACNTAGDPPAVSAYVRQNCHDDNVLSAKGTYARKQSNLQWFP